MKNGERLRTSGSLSYTRMRELFMAKLKELGFDASKFGMHSPRSGGASAAANAGVPGFDASKFGMHSLRSGGASAAANAGVPDHLFKRHGRWRSETAKDGYIKDSTDALMSVSRSLEL